MRQLNFRRQSFYLVCLMVCIGFLLYAMQQTSTSCWFSTYGCRPLSGLSDHELESARTKDTSHGGIDTNSVDDAASTDVNIFSTPIEETEETMSRGETIRYKTSTTIKDHSYGVNRTKQDGFLTESVPTKVLTFLEESVPKNKKQFRPTTPPIAQNRRVETVSDGRDRPKYLFSVRSAMGGGANTHYMGFKSIIMFALLTNRTLVMTPFFLFGGNVGHGLTVEHMRAFNETFDADILRELLPLATIDEYKQTCNAQNSKLLTGNISESAYNMMRTVVYRDIVNVDLPTVQSVIDVMNQGHVDLDYLINKIKDVQCLAIRSHRSLLEGFRGSERDRIKKRLETHLVRPSRVRHIVDVLHDQICDGRAYLAFHFRNKSAEEPCFFGREKYTQECDYVLREGKKLAEKASASLAELMRNDSLKCIYVACPLWSLDIKIILSKWIQKPNVITSPDLQVPAEYKKSLEDYYTLSLVEQEIAFRAKIFVGAGFSKWSDIVRDGREAMGRKSYSIRDIAKIPKDVHKTMI